CRIQSPEPGCRPDTGAAPELRARRARATSAPDPVRPAARRNTHLSRSAAGTASPSSRHCPPARPHGGRRSAHIVQSVAAWSAAVTTQGRSFFKCRSRTSFGLAASSGSFLKPPGWDTLSALRSSSACRRSPSAAVDVAAPRLRGEDRRVSSLLVMLALRSGGAHTLWAPAEGRDLRRSRIAVGHFLHAPPTRISQLVSRQTSMAHSRAGRYPRAELQRAPRGATLYVIDDPTIGLR